MQDKCKTRKSELLGEDTGRGGNFDDMEKYSNKGCPAVKKIIVRTGCIVDSIAFVYEGETFQHGGNGGSESVFNLEEGEFITEVTGGSSHFDGRWTIAWLVFSTNKGRQFKAGSPNGKSFRFAAEDGGSLSCMFGRSDRYVQLIGFYETPSISQDAIPGGGGMPDLNAIPGADRIPDAGSMPGVGNLFGKK